MEIVIDGTRIRTNDEGNVLRVALDHGMYIPHLCHHKDLSESGSCGLCLVRVNGAKKPVRACQTRIEDGMCIVTDDEEIRKYRELSMEMMLAAHPEDCSTCDKYGKCELQTLIQYMGVSAGNMRTRAKGFGADTRNPLMLHEMDRCVLCGRCVRACQELRGVGVLDFRKKENEWYIGTREGVTLKEANCRFCTACAEVCPTGAIQDRYIPEKTEKEACLVPCRNACPAGTDIPEYLRKVRKGKYEDAYAVIREKLTFPQSLGRICTHACEMKCRRGEINEAVAIRNVKRFASEHGQGGNWKTRGKQQSSTGKKVCVVGGGPAGLTAAYYLQKKGHQVTVLEKEPKAGGMLQYGIPSYRLPKSTVDQEIEVILETGIELRCNVEVEYPEELTSQYDAVLLAAGTHQGTVLPMEGNDLQGVLVNIQFLKQVEKGENLPRLGHTVVVLGGGSVAFGCARSAVKLGAKSVHVACLESRDAMTANPEEIKLAIEEGIILHPGVTFERIVGETEVTGVEFCRVLDFHFDENHRAVIEKDETSRFTVPAQNVIFAVGQRCGISEKSKLSRGRASSIAVQEDGIHTGTEHVYACGDAVYGTKSVIQAIADGRKAAGIVDRDLGGDGNIEETLADREPYEPKIGRIDGFGSLRREMTHIQDVQNRKYSFLEEEQGFTETEACREAGRCLQCDLRLHISGPVLWNECRAVRKQEE